MGILAGCEAVASRVSHPPHPPPYPGLAAIRSGRPACPRTHPRARPRSHRGTRQLAPAVPAGGLALASLPNTVIGYWPLDGCVLDRCGGATTAEAAAAYGPRRAGLARSWC